eukprot:scaffold21994_cov71-Phaeocystis_antarctica.AAC.6
MGETKTCSSHSVARLGWREACSAHFDAQAALQARSELGSRVRPEPATGSLQWGALCETWERHDAVAVQILDRQPSSSSTVDLYIARRPIVVGKREHENRVVLGSLRWAEVLDEARSMARLHRDVVRDPLQPRTVEPRQVLDVVPPSRRELVAVLRERELIEQRLEPGRSHHTGARLCEELLLDGLGRRLVACRANRSFRTTATHAAVAVDTAAASGPTPRPVQRKAQVRNSALGRGVESGHNRGSPLHTTQGHHRIKRIRVSASNGYQQLTVKAAESLAEELPLDWVRVDLQRVALQGQDEDAAAAQWVTGFTLHTLLTLLLVVFVVGFLDEVQAVLHEAKRMGLLPLARDRAAVLAGERKDLYAVVHVVADEELLAYHRHLTRMRLGVEGDDLVLLRIVIGEYAKEQPAGREDWGVDVFVWIFVVRDFGSGVSEAADSLLTECGRVKELLAGGDIAITGRQLEAGAAAHVTSKDAHRGSRSHYQFVAARCHRHADRALAEQIPREVERHSCQAAPALARCLPAVRPPRAH